MDLYELDRCLAGGSPVSRLLSGGSEVWPAGKPAGRPLFAVLRGRSSVPTTARTGQVLREFSGPGVIAGGGYDSPQGTGATYLEADTGRADVTLMGAHFRFDTVGGTKTTDGGSLCLASWADGGIAHGGGFGRRTGAHVVITRGAVQWYVRDAAPGGSTPVTPLEANGSTQKAISPPLARDVTHRVEITIDRVNHVGTVRLGDGRTFSWTDSRITSYPGEVFICGEPYYGGTEPTDARTRLERMWGDGTPKPAEPVTPLFIDGGSAPGATASNVNRITIPTVRDGDQLVLAAVIAQLNSGIVQTLGPTFAAGTYSTRNGLASRVLTRTAMATDSGQQVELTFGNSLVTLLSLLVVRNVDVLGTATATNGSPNASPATPIPTAAAWSPASDRLPLQVLCLSRSAGAASTPQPPAETLRVGGLDPTTGRVTGVAFAYGDTPGEAIGTGWTNPSNHIWSVTAMPVLLPTDEPL
jgi:hypothetical protein